MNKYIVRGVNHLMIITADNKDKAVAEFYKVNKERVLMVVEHGTKCKVLLAGKITGEPVKECFYKFTDARYDIRWMFTGVPCEVINPLYLDGISFGVSHDEAVDINLRELKTCTHLYMLKDWQKSKGARYIHAQAERDNIQIIYEEF